MNALEKAVRNFFVAVLADGRAYNNMNDGMKSAFEQMRSAIDDDTQPEAGGKYSIGDKSETAGSLLFLDRVVIATLNQYANEQTRELFSRANMFAELAEALRELTDACDDRLNCHSRISTELSRAESVLARAEGKA